MLSRKWAECLAFYRDVLGFRIIDEKRGFVEFEVTPESRIGLIDKGNRGQGTDSVQRGLVLSFCVDDLERARDHLCSHWPGTSDIKEHPWGARIVELKDPEGRRIEFWTQRKGKRSW
jgi:catechol 2,3-dioxygenase-like lactoylglutathione lyase family enzyme